MTNNSAIADQKLTVNLMENAKGVIYIATIEYKNKETIYIGSTGKQFE